MNKDQRCALAEMSQGTFTFKGEVATVAGWKVPLGFATVTTCLPGFYHATWEEIDRAARTGGEIRDAYLYSGRWLGARA